MRTNDGFDCEVKWMADDLAGQKESIRRLELDWDALERDGYLTPGSMRSLLAEQYRILKHQLLKNAQPDVGSERPSGRIVAVTSALPGEGKTFTAMNLAMSIAMERDVSVVVIDADLIGRSLTERMQLTTDAGLTDLLQNRDLMPGDIMVWGIIGKYAVIPAGHPAEHPSELISSERMRDVIQTAAHDCADSIILIDTSPLLSTSQAAVISDFVGQVLVVVEEGRTPQHAVTDAISIIADNVPVGLVLNKSGSFSKRNYWSCYSNP